MSRRLDRVNELLRREIGNVIQKDYEWHGKLVTVAEVEVTQDLKEGKVWTSVLGGDATPVIEKLNREHGHIQSKVMKRVVLKSTPVLRFLHDATADEQQGRGPQVHRIHQNHRHGNEPEEKEQQALGVQQPPALDVFKETHVVAMLAARSLQHHADFRHGHVVFLQHP